MSRSLLFSQISHFHTPPQTTFPKQAPFRKMFKTHLRPMNILLIFLLFLNTYLKICNGVSVLDLNSQETSDLGLVGRRACAGKIGECEAEMEEEMDSESNRRVLVMQHRYISYDTLRRDLVPCTRPGASYYNCRRAGDANPYNRGCEVITGCARKISETNS